MEDLQQLEQLLKAHDWYYMMSEDSRRYRSGSEQSKMIAQKMEELKQNGMGEEVDQLYAKYYKSLF